jgi:hypothetical protein
MQVKTGFFLPVTVKKTRLKILLVTNPRAMNLADFSGGPGGGGGATVEEMTSKTLN